MYSLLSALHKVFTGNKNFNKSICIPCLNHFVDHLQNLVIRGAIADFIHHLVLRGRRLPKYTMKQEKIEKKFVNLNKE